MALYVAGTMPFVEPFVIPILFCCEASNIQYDTHIFFFQKHYFYYVDTNRIISCIEHKSFELATKKGKTESLIFERASLLNLWCFGSCFFGIEDSRIKNVNSAMQLFLLKSEFFLDISYLL